MEGLKDFLQLVGGLGGTGVMAMFVWLWIRGEIRNKREVEAAKEEVRKAEARADMWQAHALRAMETANRSQGIAERAVGTVGQVVTSGLGQGGQS